MPFFSIIIPTRDRPALLAAAVASVLAQDFSDYEIIIVDDGSEHPPELDQLAPGSEHRGRIRIVHQHRRFRGRGPGYGRNVGVWASSGRYCAFLDDDDTWIKSDHLSLASKAIEAGGSDVDLYLSNQEALIPATGELKHLWLYPLAEHLASSGRTLQHGCYRVTVEDLLSVGGFSHLNTTIVSRALFDRISGIDENLSYEEDLDFFLRAIDRAGVVLLCPDVVARHNVPDRSRQLNASTAISQRNRMNIRLYLLNKNILCAQHGAIEQYCRQYASSTMKHLAEEYAGQGDFSAARTVAIGALANRFSVKWSLYCVYLLTRSWLPGGGKK